MGEATKMYRKGVELRLTLLEDWMLKVGEPLQRRYILLETDMTAVASLVARVAALEQASAPNPPPGPTGLTPELRAEVSDFVETRQVLPEHPWGRPNLNEPVMTIPDVWVLVDMLLNR